MHKLSLGRNSDTGRVTKAIGELIRIQVDRHGIVVWYDPEKRYDSVVEAIAPDRSTVLRYDDGFFRLREQIEPFIEWTTVDGLAKEDCMASNKIGLVGLWDAIGFDEVADLDKMPKEVVTTLKTYCESGSFARGKEMLSGIASIALFGNTNQPVETMVRSSHLFIPMPEVVREDMAFLDRLHCYIPGWEVPKPASSSTPAPLILS